MGERFGLLCLALLSVCSKICGGESTCASLPEIVHGQWSTRQCTSPDIASGTVCMLVCSSGFVLQGPSSVSCENTGKMNTDQLPTCQKYNDYDLAMAVVEITCAVIIVVLLTLFITHLVMFSAINKIKHKLAEVDFKSNVRPVPQEATNEEPKPQKISRTDRGDEPEFIGITPRLMLRAKRRLIPMSDTKHPASAKRPVRSLSSKIRMSLKKRRKDDAKSLLREDEAYLMCKEVENRCIKPQLTNEDWKAFEDTFRNRNLHLHTEQYRQNVDGLSLSPRGQKITMSTKGQFQIIKFNKGAKELSDNPPVVFKGRSKVQSLASSCGSATAGQKMNTGTPSSCSLPAPLFESSGSLTTYHTSTCGYTSDCADSKPAMSIVQHGSSDGVNGAFDASKTAIEMTITTDDRNGAQDDGQTVAAVPQNGTQSQSDIPSATIKETEGTGFPLPLPCSETTRLLLPTENCDSQSVTGSETSCIQISSGDDASSIDSREVHYSECGRYQEASV